MVSAVRIAGLVLGVLLQSMEHAALGATVCTGVAEEYFVAPAITDPAIDDPPQNHLAFINRTLPQRDELVLWFPGSCAPPFPYQAFLREAANSGYRAIGLSYPNCPEVNATCNAQEPLDVDCHEKMRTERLHGTDTSALITVTPANAIRNRIVKLLQYLDATFPTDGWGQFVVSGEPAWASIVVAGHSQGGGHAANVGREFAVTRVAMFDWTDILPNGMAAPWLSKPKSTPAERFFGIAHLQSFFAAVGVGWNALGLPPTVVDVDTTPEPYGGASRLTTNVLPSSGDYGDAHGSVVTDLQTPLRSDGTPLLSELWRYLIGATPPAAVALPTTRLSMKDGSAQGDASRRKITFRAKTRSSPTANRVVPPVRGGDGDPTLHGAMLQVFNASAGVEVAKIVLPSSGWRSLGSESAPRGFRFDDGVSDPAIRRVVVQPDTLIIEGGGSSWCYSLDEPSQGRVGMRLTLGSGMEWCAEAPAKSGERNDRVDRFVAQPKTSPPAACPIAARPL